MLRHSWINWYSLIINSPHNFFLLDQEQWKSINIGEICGFTDYSRVSWRPWNVLQWERSNRRAMPGWDRHWRPDWNWTMHRTSFLPALHGRFSVLAPGRCHHDQVCVRDGLCSTATMSYRHPASPSPVSLTLMFGFPSSDPVMASNNWVKFSILIKFGIDCLIFFFSNSKIGRIVLRS